MRLIEITKKCGIECVRTYEEEKKLINLLVPRHIRMRIQMGDFICFDATSMQALRQSNQTPALWTRGPIKSQYASPWFRLQHGLHTLEIRSRALFFAAAGQHAKDVGAIRGCRVRC